MKDLAEKGTYTITLEMKERLADFAGGYATQERAALVIRRLYEQDGYVIDPHTAVAAAVYEDYRAASGDDAACVIASTASPYKFPRSVMEAMGEACGGMTDFDLIERLSDLSRTPVPRAIEEIRTAPVLHTRVCGRDEMKKTVEEILGLS